MITGTDFADGEIDFSSIKYISKHRYEQDKNIQINNNDILITKDGSIGKVAIVKNMLKPATLNAGVYRIRVRRKGVEPEYLYQYLSGPFLLDFASKQSSGGTIKHLNQSQIMDFNVPFTIFDEQKKISSLLSKLDMKIKLVKTKMLALKKYKKGIQKMVFKSKTIESNLKLGTLVSFMPKSKLSAGNSIENGKYPFYLSGEKIGTINSFMYEGCYIIANDGGEAGFRLSNGPFAYSDHCICFRANNERITRNIYEYLDSDKHKITYVGFLGSGLKNIDRDYLQSYKISEAVLIEKYAVLFSLLSAKIQNLKSKLISLNIIKKYLLLNMFI